MSGPGRSSQPVGVRQIREIRDRPSGDKARDSRRAGSAIGSQRHADDAAMGTTRGHGQVIVLPGCRFGGRSLMAMVAMHAIRRVGCGLLCACDMIGDDNLHDRSDRDHQARDDKNQGQEMPSTHGRDR